MSPEFSCVIVTAKSKDYRSYIEKIFLYVQHTFRDFAKSGSEPATGGE
jgi:hypothetical protein